MGVLAAAGSARAQEQAAEGPRAPDGPVEATGVGIAGGVIVGAELIFLLEAAIGVEPVWPWVVFPLLGAAGGGVGGYFLENASPEGAIALLVAGLAAIIPTAMAISASRAYDPEREGAVAGDSVGERGLSFELPPRIDDVEGGTTTEVESRPDEIPEDAGEPPGAEEGGAGPEARAPGPARDSRARHLASGSLLHVHRDFGFGWGVPAPEVRVGPVPGAGVMPGVERDRGLEINLPILRVDLP